MICHVLKWKVHLSVFKEFAGSGKKADRDTEKRVMGTVERNTIVAVDGIVK